MSESITSNPPSNVKCWRMPAVCLALAAITFAVFTQTAGFGFVNFDDDTYVYENARVAGGLSWKGLVWVFTHADCSLYHPLTMLSLMADHQFHGLHPGGYHLANVLLHTASVILLFLVLCQMTGALWRSAFVAAVFAIHPMRVESVAWVSERKDVLSGLFFMLTIGAYVRYVRQPNSLGRYLVVAVAFVLALLSKPTVVTLPFVLLLLDYWPLLRKEPIRRLVLEKIPLLALAAGACALTVLTARTAIASNESVSMLSRLGNAVVSYAVYLRQMVWPEGLTPFYPPPEKGYPVWVIALCFLLLVLISGRALVLRRKRPWLLAGWLWYLGMLTPMIGLVQVGAFAHADRMTYLPQIGICVALTWLVAEWQVSRMVLAGLMIGVLVVLMICARKQTAYWRDSETLWTHTLACTTDNDIAHNDLGDDLLHKGRRDEAIVEYQQALQINPKYAEAHYNLGNVLRQMGKLDDAMVQYQKALQINPLYENAYCNVGIVLLQKGSVDEAITHFQNALAIEPRDVDANNNLGSALLQKGKLDEAITQFQVALQIEPDSAVSHFNLGIALLQKGRADETIAHYKKALEIKPDYVDALNNLAWLLATCPNPALRNGRKAVELATQANALTGGENPIVLHTLAAAFAEAGRFGDAVQSAQKAMALARAAGQQDLAEHLNDELKRYEAGLPLPQ